MCDPTLRTFRLYETRTRLYLVGRSKDRKQCRILKLNRHAAADLEVTEDPVVYTDAECSKLLAEINDGNVNQGGLSLMLQVILYGLCIAARLSCTVLNSPLFAEPGQLANTTS